MSGRFPQPPGKSSRPSSEVSSALFRRQRLWLKLAAYRPLAVLASIWVGLLAIALLAYGQLLQTTTELPQSAAPAPKSGSPQERTPAGAKEPLPSAEAESATAESKVPAESSPAPAQVPDNAGAAVGAFSFWTLLALVGTCALGSWLLSVQLKSPPRSRKKKPKAAKPSAKKRLVVPNREPAGIAANQPQSIQTPRRLSPYDPSQPLVGTEAAQPTDLPPQHSQTPQPQSATATTSPDVTVVSNHVQHRLDWPAESLVNTADVRQRRSLSSFM